MSKVGKEVTNALADFFKKTNIGKKTQIVKDIKEKACLNETLERVEFIIDSLSGIPKELESKKRDIQLYFQKRKHEKWHLRHEELVKKVTEKYFPKEVDAVDGNWFDYGFIEKIILLLLEEIIEEEIGIRKSWKLVTGVDRILSQPEVESVADVSKMETSGL